MMNRTGALAFALLTCWVGPGAICAEVRYTLTYVDQPAPGFWDVEVVARDLDRRVRDWRFELEDWGEWTEVAGSYITDLESDPPLQKGAGSGERFAFQLSRRFAGTLRLTYRIPLRVRGSEEQRRHGLLPWRLEDLASGFAHNTLPRLRRGGQQVAQRRSFEFRAPQGMTIATGWGGVSVGRQQVELDHDIDQCVILFGNEPHRSSSLDPAVEVVQFGAVPDVTADLLSASQRLIAGMERSTGHRLGRPEWIFITGNEQHGGGGGVRTDHGISLGYSNDIGSPYALQTLAHELFHEWLPGALPADGPRLIWFFEGFTDYMALWHAARESVVERDWFGSRMLEIDRAARSSSAHGKTRYSDLSVRWRDGDGPLETLAYKGGALLAFHLDVQLRHEKSEGVVTLLRDHLAAPEPAYSLRSIESWLKRRGLRAFYRRHIEQGEPLPDTRKALESVGFFSIEGERECNLTWFGIETDGGTGPGKVTAIHPEGPQAGGDLMVGDVVVDFGPRRAETRLKEGKTYSHAFGLTRIDHREGECWVQVNRGGKTTRIPIEPWLQEKAGLEKRRVADPQRIAAFFADE